MILKPHYTSGGVFENVDTYAIPPETAFQVVWEWGPGP